MFRVAVAQLCAKPFDKQHNLELMGRLLAEAKKRRAHLVVFPELCTTGYTAIENIGRAAEHLAGETVTKISKMAAQHGVNVVFGMAEAEDTKIYDSAILVDKHGKVAGTYRKINLWAKEKQVFARGNTPKVFEVDGHTVGVGICYDLEFPEYCRTLALLGAEIAVFPSAQPYKYRRRVEVFAKARAMENGLYLCFSDLAGKEGQQTFAGGSCVVGPDGKTLAKVSAKIGVAAATVSPEKIRRERQENTYLEDLKLTQSLMVPNKTQTHQKQNPRKL